jgi:flagellar hook-associated protein 1
MSLFSSLSVGWSGLSTSQNAINATAHNLANVETDGYSRQDTILTSFLYNTVGSSATSLKQVGLGTETATVSQVRDVFLDKAYRTELGRESYYDASVKAVDEIETVLGETEGVAFQDTLSDFWTSLQELVKTPESITVRSTFIESSVSFMDRANDIYNTICDYQNNLNSEISTQVNRINEIGKGIAELNKQILDVESAKVENANDLRDQRNSLIDELSGLTKISYKEDEDSQVSVYIEGEPFVTDGLSFEMGVKTEVDVLTEKYGGDEAARAKAEDECSNSQMYVPVWTSYGDREVYDTSEVPCTEKNTDIGSLKGIIVARGSRVGDYTDIPSLPDKADYTASDGTFDETAYNDALVKYNSDLSNYDNVIDPSVIMKMQAQFDQLINGVVTTINNILCPNKSYQFDADTTLTLSDGTTVSYAAGDTINVLDEDNAPVGYDSEKTMGEELFSRVSTPRYSTATLPDGSTIKIYNEETDDKSTRYTLGELTVNQSLLDNESKLPLSTNDSTGDYNVNVINSLSDAWGTPFSTLDPNSLTKYDFDDYYVAFVDVIANKGDTLNTIVDNQESMVNSIDTQRTSVSGVSSDEELTNLIKYQHAYNASARYVNVIDEMLEHLLNKLG